MEEQCFFSTSLFVITLLGGMAGGVGGVGGVRNGRSTLFWVDYCGHAPQKLYQCLKPRPVIEIDYVAAIYACRPLTFGNVQL